MGRDEMRPFILAVLVLLLSGCTSLDSIRAKNREGLSRLAVGITKDKVFEIMGNKTMIARLWSPESEAVKQINNPYRVETLKGKDDQIHEVLFYYTDLKSYDGAIKDDELTPIVLTDGLVVGWGWSFLNANVTKYHYQIDIR